MTEVNFTYEGQHSITIQCNENQKMKDICKSLCIKINKDLNSLIFLYGGDKLNFEKTFNEITKENKISILVYNTEDEICPECGRIINNKIIDGIISINNNVNYSLIGIQRQIEQAISDVINKADINFIINQLKNINLIIDSINNNIKKTNNELNKIKVNDNKNIKQNKNNNHKNIGKNNNNLKKNNNDIRKDGSLKNEIICIYNKQKDEINLLHEYNLDINNWTDEGKKLYIEGKNNINERNIDIYINDRKIPFNYKYKSNEKGDVRVKFKFNKLLINICCIFRGCSFLKSIDLSSFNTTNINNMRCILYECYSLKSIALSSFDTTNANDMSFMFSGCSSLESIDLSSFNTTNVEDMSFMFNDCSSLKSINLSSFNIINVNNMICLFSRCSSLKSINISSFNTINVKNM